MTSESLDTSRLTAKGRATRTRIVTVAADLVFESGVARTSLEDVRDAAGVSNSQLYHYFRDKAELVRAVVAYQADRILAGQQALAGRLDSIAALEHWRDVTVAAQARVRGVGGCPLGSLASELADVDEAARSVIVDRFFRWGLAFADGLADMQRAGVLEADVDTGRLARGLLAALQGGLLLSQAACDVGPLADALDLAIDGVRGHLAPRGGSAEE